MTLKKCVILGAGGHAHVLIDCLQLSSAVEIVGILTPEGKLAGPSIYSVPVLGDDSLLFSLLSKGIRYFVVGLGGAGNNRPRQALYERACASGLEPFSVIHPSVWLSGRAALGAGCQLMAGSIINAGAQLGANVLVNTGAIVEHDCEVGDHVHIATGAKLAGTVKINQGSHIGAGAVIRQNVVIGEYAVVGAGAVVVRNVEARTVVVGVPAKPLEKVIP